jgi:hypothetical protein
MLNNVFASIPMTFMRKYAKILYRSQMTIWLMRIAGWTRKATNTHLEYVIIIAFPLQQWIHERPSMLRYTYFTCLV